MALATQNRTDTVMVALGDMVLVVPSRRRRSPAIALALSCALHGAAFAGFLAWDDPAPEETIMMVSLVSEWGEAPAASQDDFVDAIPTASPSEPPPPIALPFDATQKVTEPAVPDEPAVAPPPVPDAMPIESPALDEIMVEPAPSPPIITSPLDLPAAMPALPPPLPLEPEPTPPAPEAVDVVTVDLAPVPPKRPQRHRSIERPRPTASPPADRPTRAETETAASAEAARPMTRSADPAPTEQQVVPSPAASAAAVASAESTMDRSLQALPPSYRRALIRWLERRKFYPPAARRAGLEGQVVLRIRLGRDGTVIETALAGSSGHAVLDEAALDLVGRAGDAPPLPADFPADQAELVAPLSFLLK